MSEVIVGSETCSPVGMLAVNSPKRNLDAFRRISEASGNCWSRSSTSVSCWRMTRNTSSSVAGASESSGSGVTVSFTSVSRVAAITSSHSPNDVTTSLVIINPRPEQVKRLPLRTTLARGTRGRYAKSGQWLVLLVTGGARLATVARDAAGSHRRVSFCAFLPGGRNHPVHGVEGARGGRHVLRLRPDLRPFVICNVTEKARSTHRSNQLQPVRCSNGEVRGLRQ